VKVNEECGMCGKEIVGYRDQVSPQVWDHPKNGPHARTCIGVRDIKTGEPVYFCLACWDEMKVPPEKVHGFSHCHATKTVTIGFQADGARAFEQITKHKISEEDALKIVEWFVEQGIVTPFVSFE
jgi:hypothetical protein